MLDYDPFSEAVRNDPQPIYRRLRDEAPAFYLPKYDAWALSRFEDIWRASADTQTFSAARGTAPAQLLTRDQPVTPMLNVMDPPEHTRLRSVIRRCFLPAHVRQLEPWAREFADHLLDEVATGGTLDIVSDFAARLSVSVACRAVGIPLEDGPLLTDWVQRFFHHEPEREGVTPEGLVALRELTDYCAELIRSRRRRPSEAPAALDALCEFEVDGRRLDVAAAASHATMLVIGGSETFPKVLANGLVRLREHPDQRSELVADPSLIPDAFNEILRYDMPTQFLGRTVRCNVEIHGQVLLRGQAVLFLFASANHDEREFDRPEIFDIHRRPARILSFGAGAHQCLGTHVARMEGRVSLEAILSRWPQYELDLERAQRLRTEFVQGYASLPLIREA